MTLVADTTYDHDSTLTAPAGPVRPAASGPADAGLAAADLAAAGSAGGADLLHAEAPPAVPRYDPHCRLTTRRDLDDRVEGLLPTAVVRQLWLLLLDADDVQMPAMIPIGDLPLRQGDADGEGVGELLTTLDREFGVASYVFVLERPGSPDLTDDDRTWLAHVLTLGDGRPFAVRAAYLCHDDGVTQFQREDVAVG